MTIAAYVFDAYGTLFDVHAAVRRHASRIGPEAQRFSELWRTKQLEYTWVRSLMGRYRDFAALTEEALDFALAVVPPADPSVRDDLLASYAVLDAYPEVPEVLARLKQTGARLAILSNGSPAMLERAVESAGIGGMLDAVLSVHALRLYKTAPVAYDMIADRLGVALKATSFQSSNRWDIAGATARGIRAVWVNRTGQPDEYRELPPAAVISDLHGLP